MSKILTKKEVAIRLRVSGRTVDRLTDLPRFQIGNRKTFFLEQVVDEWVAAKANAATTETPAE